MLVVPALLVVIVLILIVVFLVLQLIRLADGFCLVHVYFCLSCVLVSYLPVDLTENKFEEFLDRFVRAVLDVLLYPLLGKIGLEEPLKGHKVLIYKDCFQKVGQI